MNGTTVLLVGQSGERVESTQQQLEGGPDIMVVYRQQATANE